MDRRPRKIFRAWCEQLEDRSLLSMLTPAQVRQAYGMNAIEFSANGQTIQGTGAGQTIAIVGAFYNPFVSGELDAFDAAYGLSTPALVQVDLAGAQTNLGWAEEEALDVEWSHVMAPAASIIVVEAASANTSDLMNAVNLARKLPGVSVVSMSWGGSEFRGQTNYDPFFTTPAGHNGVTFVTASGDNGSKYGADWPASSPNVVGVGGTTLWVDAAGNSLLQTAWSGSGGGYSVLEREPGYQTAVQRKGRRFDPRRCDGCRSQHGSSCPGARPIDRPGLLGDLRRHQPLGPVVRRPDHRRRPGPNPCRPGNPGRRHPDPPPALLGLFGRLSQYHRRLERPPRNTRL